MDWKTGLQRLVRSCLASFEIWLQVVNNAVASVIINLVLLKQCSLGKMKLLKEIERYYIYSKQQGYLSKIDYNMI